MQQVLIALLILLSGVVLWLAYQRTAELKPKKQEEKKEVVTKVIVSPPIERRRQRGPDPEFRGPPFRTYKPGRFQQVGLLNHPTDPATYPTRPLYGNESPYYRDRYIYYTTTLGDQIFPIPVTYDGRDCTEDIGCPEFYGNETVIADDNNQNYTVSMYRVNF